MSIAATIGVWLAKLGLIYAGIDADSARLLACGLVIPALLKAGHPEGINASALTLVLLTIGLFIGALIAYVRYHGTQVQISNDGGAAGIVIYLVLVSVVVPFFEELVVRRLLFRGAASYLGAPLGAILVSGLFGLVHIGAFWIAFTASLLLCAMTSMGITTFNRSVAHGAYNFSFTIVVMLLSTSG